jgi:hypothetical protein
MDNAVKFPVSISPAKFSAIHFSAFLSSVHTYFDSSVWTVRRKSFESRRSMAFSARTESCCFSKVFSFDCEVKVTGMKAVSILGKEACARENIEIAAKFCLTGEPYSKIVAYRSSYWRMDSESPESAARVSGSIG